MKLLWSFSILALFKFWIMVLQSNSYSKKNQANALRILEWFRI